MPYLLDDIGQQVQQSRYYYALGYTGTTDGSKNLTLAHGAPFTPGAVFIQPTIGAAHAVDVESFDAIYFTTKWDTAALTVTFIALFLQ